MLLKYSTSSGEHWIHHSNAMRFLRCSRRTLDNYRHRSDTPGARLLRAHATGRLLPECLGIWYSEKDRRLFTDTGATWELHELTQPDHWASVQAATIADLKTRLHHKETEVMHLKHTIATLTAAGLAACASSPKPADYPAHVAPLQGGQYAATATDSDPQRAAQAALIYARGQCSDTGDKQPAIIEAAHDSNEPDTTGKQWGSAIAQAGTALYAHNTGRTYIPPAYTYRTTLRFTCEAPE